MTAVLVSVGSLILLYWGVLTKLVHDWATDDNYSHGFVIAPLAAYFAYERRAQLLSLPHRPTAVGLLVILGSMATLVAGQLGAELFLARISLIGVLVGAILFVWGYRHARVLLFPLAFLFLMV